VIYLHFGVFLLEIFVILGYIFCLFEISDSLDIIVICYVLFMKQIFNFFENLVRPVRINVSILLIHFDYLLNWVPVARILHVLFLR